VKVKISIIEWPWRFHRLQGQSRQKSLNRFATSAVLTAVLAIDRWPSPAWIARGSWPLLAGVYLAFDKNARRDVVRSDCKLQAGRWTWDSESRASITKWSCAAR
jgi:hypothetical protein